MAHGDGHLHRKEGAEGLRPYCCFQGRGSRIYTTTVNPMTVKCRKTFRAAVHRTQVISLIYTPSPYGMYTFYTSRCSSGLFLNLLIALK